MNRKHPILAVVVALAFLSNTFFASSPAFAQGNLTQPMPSVAGSGLTKSGNTLNVIGATGGGIAVTADAIGLLTSCNDGSVLAWNALGTAWVCSAAAGVTGAGTTNRVAKFTGPSVMGDTAFPIDDGAGTLVLGDNQASDLVTVNGRLTSAFSPVADTASHGLSTAFTMTGQTTSQRAAISGSTSGTADTTSASVQVRGIFGLATATRSAGANLAINEGVFGQASGGQTNRGVYGFVSGAGATTNEAVRAETTATGTTNLGLNASAGGAGTTNVGVSADAFGAGTNIALRTLGGDVFLNTTANNTGVGYASGASIPAKLAVITSGAGTTFNAQNTPSASTTSRNTITASNTGTFDTTAGGLTSIVGTFSATTTRSAGANNLTNVGGLFGASGGQVNIAVQTNAGDDYLNTTSGSTGVGYASAAALPAKLSVTSSTQALDVVSTSGTASGAAFTWTPVASTTDNLNAVSITSNGTYDTTSGTKNTRALTVAATASRSAGASVLNSFAVIATATGAQNNFAYRSTDGTNSFNTASGSTSVGYTATTTLPGKFSVTSAAQSLDVISTSGTTNASAITWTPVAGTASNLSTIRAISNGTLDTTAGVLEAHGITVGISNTRSAGANVLTNIAGYFDASGAQTNIALRTHNGDNFFNASSGLTGVGYASTATLPAKLSVTSAGAVTSDFLATPSASTTSLNANAFTVNGTMDTTAGSLSSTGAVFTVSTTRSAGANSVTNTAALFTATGGQVNRAFKTNDGDVLLNSVSGTTTIGFSQATASALTVSGQSTFTSTNGTTIALSAAWIPVGTTSTARGSINASTSGTADTTSGAIDIRGVTANVSTTKSAGSNTLTTSGLNASATGGDDNRAVRASVTGSGATNYGALVTSTATGTTNYGVSASSTGAGTTNIGGDFTATGATTNIALRTISGENYLNTTGGGTSIGLASGAARSGTLHVATAPSAATTTQNNSFMSATGTFDTTAGAMTSRGINVSVTTTRSAGANNLTNEAIRANASGAQVNTALQTDAGNVLLNTTSGTTAIGFSTATASALTVSGTQALTSTNSTASGLLVAENFTGGTSSAIAGVRVNNTSTLDTTAGILNTVGFFSSVTATRSAGANNLQNIGIYVTATGAQLNTAIRTDDGGNFFNTVSGNTGVGYAFAASIPAKLAVTATTQALDVISTSGTTNASAITWTPVAGTTGGLGAFRVASTGTFDATAGVLGERAIIASATATRSAGANNVNNIALDANASGGQTNVALYTQNGDNYLNGLSGSTGVGYAFGTALPSLLSVNGSTTLGTSTNADIAAVNGRVTITMTNTTANALTSTYTPVGSSTNNRVAVSAVSNGTYDTTAGVLEERAISANITATRSAGANALTNVAGNFSATGAQNNVALKTVSGDNYFNDTGGSTGVGIATGGTLPAKLSINTTAKAFDVVSTSGSTSGSVITWTPVATTSGGLSSLIVTSNGTFDTTAGVLSDRGLSVSATATRSAGANNLTNRAAVLTASGAQVNIALQTDDGSNYLNTTSGSTGIGYASGATLPATLSVSGTLDVTGAINGYTQVTKPSDQDVTNAGLTDDTALTIAVTAGKIYNIEASLVFGGSDTTGDIVWDFSVPAGTMDCTGTEDSVTTADAIQNSTVIATAAADTNDTSVGTRADASLPIAVHAFIACKFSNTTTFKLRFGNNVAAAARVSRTMAGSYLRYKQLN